MDAIIIGSITQFGRDDKSTNVGGGALGGVTGRFGIGGVRKSQSNAVVQITARMIDTSTAEILASASGKGESSRSGTGLLGAGGSGYGAGGGGIDMKSSNFGATILGEAVNKAVTDLAQQLDAKAASLPTTVVQISGLVADASPDGTVIVNVGSKDGVKVGDRLDIRRKVRDVKDPPPARRSAASKMPSAPSPSPKWTSRRPWASSRDPLRPKSATPYPLRSDRPRGPSSALCAGAKTAP